jgi:hypothetical protein
MTRKGRSASVEDGFKGDTHKPGLGLDRSPANSIRSQTREHKRSDGKVRDPFRHLDKGLPVRAIDKSRSTAVWRKLWRYVEILVAFLGARWWG